MSELLSPTTCVLPDAVVIPLRGCTDCVAEFRVVAVGFAVIGGKPPSLLFGELPGIPRGAGLSWDFVLAGVASELAISELAISESTKGRGFRTGADEPAIAGGDVFDNEGKLELSELPGARRLVPFASMDLLGGDASKVLAEFKLSASRS